MAAFLSNQGSSLVAHWISVSGDHIQIQTGEKNFPLSFLSCDLMIAAYLQKLNNKC